MRAGRVWDARTRTYQIAWHSKREFADSGRKISRFSALGLTGFFDYGGIAGDCFFAREEGWDIGN